MKEPGHDCEPFYEPCKYWDPFIERDEEKEK